MGKREAATFFRSQSQLPPPSWPVKWPLLHRAALRLRTLTFTAGFPW